MRPLLRLGLLCLGLLMASPALQARGGETPAETLLRQVFSAIEASELGTALDTSQTLVDHYPNFRLAHLIRGDLLLARVKPLQTFGELAHLGPQDNLDLAGLRDEARVRLAAYRNAPDAPGHLPRDLLRLAPRHRHAIVVDTARARLYVLRNAGDVPEKIADFYISHGKAGADKRREGDNRTPLGIYHVTGFIPPDKLPDFYGSGAFPINYPNPHDRQLGRTGSGIWLHGTPTDTYARPPLASEGCVVLANDDLERLGRLIEPGNTPVLIGAHLEWVDRQHWQAEATPLLDALERWRSDWESLDTSRYLAHYAQDFRTETQSLPEWARQKRAIAQARRWIKLELSDLTVLRNPADPDLVEVTFRQDYRSDGLADVMHKRQFWRREGHQWKIVYEGAA